MVLGREFYQRETDVVARDLLGKILVCNTKQGTLKGKIVETEAYFGITDPASHARFGKTDRNYLMFGNAGYIYVYLIYGMYYCLNFVTDQEGTAGAVLIRALEPIENIEAMKKNRKTEKLIQLTNGPGKLCQAFGIEKNFNGLDLCDSKGILYVVSSDEEKKEDIMTSKRVGIKMDLENEYRYFIKNNRFVSK